MPNIMCEIWEGTSKKYTSSLDTAVLLHNDILYVSYSLQLALKAAAVQFSQVCLWYFVSSANSYEIHLQRYICIF